MTNQTEVTTEPGLNEFEALRSVGKWGEARALCFRMLARAETQRDTFRWLQNYAVCEYSRGDLHNALTVLSAAAYLLPFIADDRLLGNHYNNLAILHRRLARYEEAFINYAGAAYHYERCGREDLQASVLNNRGVLLVKIGRAAGAIGPLEEAQAIYKRLGDFAHLAEVHDSLSQAYKAIAGTTAE